MVRFLPLLCLLLACAGARPESAARNETAQSLLVGMYTYMADAAMFTRCDTGARVPVATEGESLALERAYLAAAHEPGAPVLVTVQGRFETRPPMEGAPREHLIVDAFDGIWPGEVCEKAGVETTLKNTYWKLVELDGAPVRAREGQREVHMLLRLDTPAVRGFAACNSFSGGYALDGTSLRFEGIASTLAACPHMDEETAYFAALGAVTRYRIFGETLVLFGDAGQIARFRAVYF